MDTVNFDLSFLFHEDVQRIFNNFTQLFQIRIAFYSPDGNELKVGNNLDICKYCRAVRSCPKGKSACMEEDKNARLRAFSERRLIVYTCHGGLKEAIKPIIQEENLIGYAMIGQVRFSEKPPARWECLVKREDSDLSLKDIFLEQKFYSEAELARILELFSDLMNLLSDRKMIQPESEERTSKLIVYLKNNHGKKISLDEAAKLLFLSPSRVSHFVKERYGITFSALQRRIKIEHARFLLSHYPDKSIKEIAFETGFDDPRYFSRIFKQESGLNALQYRKQQNYPPN